MIHSRAKACPRRVAPGRAYSFTLVSRELAPPLAAARVVLLTGPSGSGKSVPRRPLRAARAAPRRLLQGGRRPDAAALLDGSSDIDWDSPLSWDADAAVAAIDELCRTGRTTSRCTTSRPAPAVGEEALDIGRAPLFIAEGIFAADIVGALPGAGAAGGRAVPARAARRRRSAGGLLRDLREGRKSVPFLLRRGLAADARRARDRGPAHGAGRAPVRPGRGAGPARRPRRAPARTARPHALTARCGGRDGTRTAREQTREAGLGQTPRPLRARASSCSPVLPRVPRTPAPPVPRFGGLPRIPVSPSAFPCSRAPPALRRPARRRTPPRHGRS